MTADKSAGNGNALRPEVFRLGRFAKLPANKKDLHRPLRSVPGR